MKLSAFVKTVVFSLSFVVVFHFAPTNIFAEQRTCCTDAGGGNASGNCDGCRAEGIETKNNGTSCNGAANCEVCPASHPRSNQCGGSSTSNPATCTQSVYNLENPTNLTVGQTKDFYADGRATNGNFSRMVASVVNVPTSLPAIATVATTSGPTCYANGNCRQGFRLTAKSNGTARVRVATLVKLCPACAETGFCERYSTLNVGAVTPLSCKAGAACTKSGNSVTCTMPALTTAELNGGTVSYQSECTPYKNTVAQTKIVKSSTTGAFTAFTMATGVTNVKCSFRHCVTGTNGVTQCTDWGKAS